MRGREGSRGGERRGVDGGREGGGAEWKGEGVRT